MDLEPWLLFLLVALSVARVTRLVTADKILDPIRDRIEDRFGSPDESKFMYLLTCDWCASIWIAPPMAAAAVLWGDNRLVVGGLLALGASQVTGMLAAKEMQ